MTDSIEQALEARKLWASENVSGFRIVNKADSGLMKAMYYASLMFIWNRRFMKHFHTTLGATIYVCRPLEGLSGLATLNHELKHIQDSRRLGTIVWSLGYLLPQSLAPLAILAIWWWPALAFLLCLGPWPAPFRVWAERRGYEQSMETIIAWGGGQDEAEMVEWLRPKFCGRSYYWMAWRWAPLKRHFEKVVKAN